MIELILADGTKRHYDKVKEVANYLHLSVSKVTKALDSNGDIGQNRRVKRKADKVPKVIAFPMEGSSIIFKNIEEAVNNTDICEKTIKTLIRNGEVFRGYTFDYLYDEV